MPNYYKPSLPISLKKEIEKLFAENEQVRNLYDNNKVEFIKEAIREKIKNNK